MELIQGVPFRGQGGKEYVSIIVVPLKCGKDNRSRKTGEQMSIRVAATHKDVRGIADFIRNNIKKIPRTSKNRSR